MIRLGPNYHSDNIGLPCMLEVSSYFVYLCALYFYFISILVIFFLSCSGTICCSI